MTAAKACDNAELMELLQVLSQDNTKLKQTAQQHLEDVPSLMQRLQEVRLSHILLIWLNESSDQELYRPSIIEQRARDYRKVLRELHSDTALLPPLADCESPDF